MRKGQITPFIIIGIIIIVSIATVTYLRSRAIREGIDIEDVTQAPAAASQVGPVDSFVKSCIKDITEEGLRLAEQHGGYIYLDKLDPDLVEPTEGNAIEMIQGSGIIVPYWYHMSSRSTCQGGCSFDSMAPPLCKAQRRDCITNGPESIEDQLEKYILENLDECLADFEPMNEMGFDVAKLDQEPQILATVRDEDVLIRLNYPLKITVDESTTELSQFSMPVMSDIKELYTLAHYLMNYESKNCFIGQHTQNYLSFFMGIDGNEIPPIYEMTIAEFTEKNWVLALVKEDLKSKFATAIKIIGIANTRGFVWPKADPDDEYYKMKQGILDRRVFQPFGEFHNVDVSLTYLPLWKPYIDITPREGNILKPTDFGSDVPFGELFSHLMQMKVYEFQYHYTFPVVAEISKFDRFGNGHIFRIALETNVRSNRCYGPNITMVHNNPVSPMICDPAVANSEANITVKETIYDQYGRKTDVPVPGVRVTYFAGATCLLGYTDEDGKLNARYANAHGNQFKFSKPDYSEKIVVGQVIKDGEDIFLTRPAKIDTSVKHYKVNRDGTLSSPVDLVPGEQVIININKLDEPRIDSQVLTFSGKSEGDMQVKLVEGTYEIEANYFTNESYVLPPNCAHICEGGVDTDDSWDSETNTPISKCCGEDCPLGEDCVCHEDSLIEIKCCDDASKFFPDEEQNVSVMGGAKFNQDTILWRVEEGAVMNAYNIEFKVLSNREADCVTEDDCIIPGCIGYAEEMERLQNYYSTHAATLKPKVHWS